MLTWATRQELRKMTPAERTEYVRRRTALAIAALIEKAGDSRYSDEWIGAAFRALHDNADHLRQRGAVRVRRDGLYGKRRHQPDTADCAYECESGIDPCALHDNAGAAEQ